MTFACSIVMPAHNEERVVARALASITASAAPGEFEIVVVANGCSDGTADAARSGDYPVQVVEITTASKIAALNTGDEHATAFPRIYVDADVEIDAATIRELVATLDAGALVASPPFEIDSSRSSLAVRQHYRVWALSDYVRSGHIGSGVFALSRAGRERFGLFPDVIADDRFVQQLFALDERGTTANGSFRVHAPRTFSALIRRSLRASAGNQQLTELGLAGTSTAASAPQGALVRRVVRRPDLWLAFVVYSVGYAAPRLLARARRAAGRPLIWHRDETSRA